MLMNFKGKLAVVTGATRGIGYAIAVEFQKMGAEVIVTGTDPSNLSFKNFRYYSVDFLCDESTQRMVDFLSQQQPDILINNAGINATGAFQEITLENFTQIQRVNVIAPFRLCQAVIPAMRENSWGRIVNISSVFGQISKSERAPYSSSKFAIDGMTAALAAEVASYGILANCVAPGFIATDLTKKILGDTGITEIVKQIPIKRLGQPEEIAKFVVWLASPENTYISGQNIAIDGGFTRV